MTRLRWGLGTLAVFAAAVVALFTYSWHNSAESDPGPGLLDPAHVSAARAVILALPVLPGTTVEPYDTACRAPAALCASSQVPPRALLDEAGSALKSAGATRVLLRCPHPDDVINPLSCMSVYDVQGAHITVVAGDEGAFQTTGRTYVGLRVATTPAPAGRTVEPLGNWAVVNPFPVAWKLATSCLKSSPAGCTDYRHQKAQGAPINASLQQAYAAARASLTAGGFRIDDANCFAAGASGIAHCMVAGGRFRSPGGVGNLIAVVTVSTVDTTHVRVVADVSAF
jgi:hypothetical protein